MTDNDAQPSMPEILKRIESAEETATRTLAIVEDISRKQDESATASAHRDELMHREIVQLRGVSDTHTKTLATLTDQTAKHGAILVEHARMHTQHAESIAASRETSRLAVQSSSDIAVKHDEFQAAVMNHLAKATDSISKDTELLRRNDEAQNIELRAQSSELRLIRSEVREGNIVTSAVAAELGITDVAAAVTDGKAAPPKRTITSLIRSARWSGLGVALLAIAYVIKTAIELFHH